MNLKDDEFAKQLIAELLDANEQAFAVLALAVGDVTGPGALFDSLKQRLDRARAAQRHPTRDRLLATALAGLHAQL